MNSISCKLLSQIKLYNTRQVRMILLGKIFTQASKSEYKTKLYSFYDRTIYVRDGIYRGPSLRTLHKMTILPLIQIITTLFNYKGEVVFFSFRAFILQLLVINLLDVFVFLDLVDFLSVFFCLQSVRQSQILVFAQSCFLLFFSEDEVSSAKIKSFWRS